MSAPPEKETAAPIKEAAGSDQEAVQGGMGAPSAQVPPSDVRLQAGARPATDQGTPLPQKSGGGPNARLRPAGRDSWQLVPSEAHGARASRPAEQRINIQALEAKIRVSLVVRGVAPVVARRRLLNRIKACEVRIAGDRALMDALRAKLVEVEAAVAPRGQARVKTPEGRIR
jgi:hypothetical protein